MKSWKKRAKLVHSSVLDFRHVLAWLPKTPILGTKLEFKRLALSSLHTPLECRSIWWTIPFRNSDSKVRNTAFTCVNTYCAVWMGVNVTSLFSKARKMDLHQSHKLVSIPFRVNWLIQRSIIVQQRCRDSRNHRERNGEKSIYSHYHHSFLFPHRRQKVKLDKPMW